ncbi:methionine ABC transporter ATP-binding protein [Aquitalea magnusonii]|uniref:Cell division ATP-binding protein FtsE n=2 Tax=Aquitalea magnusonii TaxID=332411 RepID=A0A318J4Y6_9NEIS|nr:ATP-binding cassette domain-containing protein [Aquitalea magnusonii]PXX42175.1 D-methionine transport system ATP-binding protein [Aquitalea magnusonii]
MNALAEAIRPEVVQGPALWQREAEPAGEALVSFRQVGRQFQAGGRSVQALQEVSFDIRRGEIFGIIGRSGAGKSTLLRTINRLESPGSGQVLVAGKDLSGLNEAQLAQARRGIGMIFQHFNLLSSRTVAQNIGLPLKIAGLPQAEIDARVDSLLQLVGLEGKRDVYPSRLSGGQKQRVGIARALVHQPELLLCDEATSALDPETTQSILALLRDINRQLKVTVVLITHEMAVIREVCDRVAVLEAGKVVELGPVWQVFGAPQADATRALLASLNHELPADVAGRIVQEPASAQSELLLDVRLDGVSGQDPALGPLVAALGPATRLLHGGVERIQGRAQGRLVLACAPQSRNRLGDLARQLAIPAGNIRILGYVDHA